MWHKGSLAGEDDPRTSNTCTEKALDDEKVDLGYRTHGCPLSNRQKYE